MSMIDKIKTILEGKIEEQEKALLENADVKFQMDEDGNPLLDEDGNPIPEEKDMEDDEEEDDMEDEKDMKDEKKKESCKESLEKIFSKIELPEGVSDELETLFNAIVAEKVAEEVKIIEAKNDEDIESALEEIQENIDKYITYAAEEWNKENEVQVESGIKIELAENLVEGLKEVFVENYVEVPEDKVDLVDEAAAELTKIEAELDEAKNANIELQKEINGIKATKIVDELSSELTDTQKEKLSEMTDSIEYKNDSDYTDKVKLVITNFFKEETEEDNKKLLDEETHKVDDKKSDRMAAYLAAFKKD